MVWAREAINSPSEANDKEESRQIRISSGSEPRTGCEEIVAGDGGSIDLL